MGIDITFIIKGPKNGINAIRDVIPANIWVNIPSTTVISTTIFWFIPDIEYCFNCDKILDLLKSETKVPFLGLILIETVPYSGGSNSSPPTTDTVSVSG